MAISSFSSHFLAILLLLVTSHLPSPSSSSRTPPLVGAVDNSFDVRRHLSTTTRYDIARGSANVALTSSDVPDGCSVIHLNLVARHGTRSPTKKRIKELDKFAVRLGALVHEAKELPEGSSLLQKIPSWMDGWESPWRGRTKGGELVIIGEEELYNLSIRVRERFTELFDEEYHPDIYPIKATQVPRASASAVAFGLGLFSGKGKLGTGQYRSFSVISESRASDTCLRFHDICGTYKEYRESQEPAVEKLKEPILEEIASAASFRHHLNFTKNDISSLWFLCKQEASLLDITDQACGLFNELEVHLLEWTDDLEFFLLKGYGNSINYHMGVPLLKDVVDSMEQAILAKEENALPGTYEKARLRFAHAETVVPFTCLLGLFLEGSEFEKIQKDEQLSPPQRPPKRRNWKGSSVAPFAGNNMLVLYHCPSKSSDTNINTPNRNGTYFLQVLHNEAPVQMPGCGNTYFCPFEVFKEKVAEPHLRHDFDMVCNIKPVNSDSNSKLNKELATPCSLSCKLLRFLKGFFFQKAGADAKSEL